VNGDGSSCEWQQIDWRIEGEEPIKEYLPLEAVAVGRRTWESGGSTGDGGGYRVSDPPEAASGLRGDTTTMKLWIRRLERIRRDASGVGPNGFCGNVCGSSWILQQYHFLRIY
jgi:hypothetical protein